jgi:hypothetical protein
MTPEQHATITAIAAIISQVGTWPIGSIIALVVFGPWVIMGLVSRSMEKRHEAALKMYESNVKLVVNYEKISKDQADTIRLSTAATTELTTYLKTRPPCYERMAEKFGSKA